jgi:hypothetical protein
VSLEVCAVERLAVLGHPIQGHELDHVLRLLAEVIHVVATAQVHSRSTRARAAGRWRTIVRVTKRLACTAGSGAMLELFRGVMGFGAQRGRLTDSGAFPALMRRDRTGAASAAGRFR